jgi:hypothetical protein
MSRSKKFNQTGRVRNKRGAAILLLALLLGCSLLVFASLSGASLIRYFAVHRHAEAAVEAASLAAARELSAAVVADPDCGYIALSDFAPSGATTLLAEDGKPVPVIGINTLTATARVSMLVAKHLNNEEYLRLARLDSTRARAAQRRLVEALKLCLRQDPRAPLNKDGKPVLPLTAARREFSAAMKSTGSLEQISIKSIELDLGSLVEGGITNTPLPIVSDKVDLDNCRGQNGFYSAFVDCPVIDESFVFAAVGAQPALVSKKSFMVDAGRSTMPSSIIRAKVSLALKAEGDKTFSQVNVAACAAPYSLSDRAAAGVMVVGLPDGTPTGYHTLADYINDPRSSRTNMEMFMAHGGDYPLDGQALLKADRSEGQTRTLANVFVQGLYDWVRTAHGRVKLDSLLSVIGSRMQPSIGSLSLGQSLVYRFTRDGAIAVEGYFLSDVPNQIVHDRQIYTLGLNTLRANDTSWTIAYRDQVRNIGLVDSGKHGGQLMEIDGCLRPVGSLYAKNLVSSRDAGERRSYYDGGLAVEFVISSPQYQ